MSGITQVIEGLQILKRYAKKEYLLDAEHDILYVNVDPALVSEKDIKRLDALGFSAETDEDKHPHFYMFT